MPSHSAQDTPKPDLCSRFEQVVERYPDQIAFKAEGGLGKEYRFDEVLQTVRAVAAGLVGHGCIDPCGIGILSENRPEWPIAYLSILAAGGTVVPIDINLKPTEVAHIVKHSGLRSAFVSSRGRKLLDDAAVNVEVFSFEDDSDSGWTELAGSQPLMSLPPPSEVAVIIYTSGTTGAPKAVELTHKNLLTNLDGIFRRLSFGPEDVFLSVLPLHHTLEASCGFLTPTMSGAMIVYARSLKSNQIKEDIAYNRVTHMVGVPLLYEKMYQSFQRKLATAPVLRRLIFRTLMSLSSATWKLGLKSGRSLFRLVRNRAGLGSVRMFVSGGAPLPPKMARFFNLLGIDFLEGYGMTECSPVVSVHRSDDIKFGSVGPPLDNVEVAIHNPDNEGVGEIVVRGNNITPGYRGLPEATAELIIDGWLHTGDLGRIREGHLWITGRRKSLIVSAAGKNIYPEELEEKLLESPLTLEAVVFGRAKEGKQGEEVRALIVPDLEQLVADGLIADVENPDLATINRIIANVVRQVNDSVAVYKRIAAFDVQLDELEKTSTRKIKRFLYK